MNKKTQIHIIIINHIMQSNKVKFGFLLLLAISFFHCENESFETPAKKTGIKSIQEIRTSHNEDGTIKEEKNFKEYDSRGNEVHHKSINEEGKVFFVKQKYNKQDQNILLEGKKYNGDTYKSIKRYDKQGKLINMESYSEDQLIFSIEIEKAKDGSYKIIKTGHPNNKIESVKEYDLDEFLIKETLYPKNDSILKTYVYDENDNLIEEVNKGKYQNQNKRYKYEYDQNNLLVESGTYELDGTQLNRTFKQYRTDKSLEQVIKTKGKTSQDKFKYNKDGLMIEHSFTKDGEAWQVLNLKEYDDHGNKIHQTKYLKNGDFKWERTTQLKYDYKGNWIEMIEKEGDRLIKSRIRTIEYY